MSEAVRLGDIIPEVLRDIEQRCERYRKAHNLPPLGTEVKSERKEHASRVFQATADFLASKDSKRLANRQTQKTGQKVLF